MISLSGFLGEYNHNIIIEPSSFDVTDDNNYPMFRFSFKTPISNISERTDDFEIIMIGDIILNNIKPYSVPFLETFTNLLKNEK